MPYLLGDIPLAEFAVCLFYASLMAVTLILFRVAVRDPTTTNSPVTFSWKYFWNDTRKRNIGTFMLMVITIRAVQYWITPKNLIYCAMLIGLVSDQLAMLALRLKGVLIKILKNEIDNTKLPTSAPKDDELNHN
jgi:hypothetical protein